MIMTICWSKATLQLEFSRSFPVFLGPLLIPLPVPVLNKELRETEFYEKHFDATACAEGRRLDLSAQLDKRTTNSQKL